MTIKLCSTVRQIGEKAFSEEDQQLFASVSLDRNPMHMDSNAARRLMTGHQVVHGIHLLITALEYWQNDNSYPIAISCSFDNPVSVGDQVVFTQIRREENDSTIEATVNGLLCSRIIITTTYNRIQSKSNPDSSDSESSKEIRSFDHLTKPLDERPAFHLNKKYPVKLNDVDFSNKFPQSYRFFGKKCFAAISALSYFVGMICPGLHSIFSSLSFSLSENDQNADRLTFSIRKYDARVHLFDISFQGCIHGSLKAFSRPPPQQQPSLKDLSTHVVAREFCGTRSLIIGGSRGLGEITAKILASGGGDVVITYASGIDDAKAIKDEINNGGMGTCEMLKVDLMTDTFNSMSIDWNSLHAVYFFATPRIFRKKAELFEPRLFQEFCVFYVRKFYDLCAHLEANITAKKLKVYFPSSIAVSERPKGMTEYSMAKSAAEVLTEDINKSFKKLSVISTRLPRLNTDQTSTILRISTASNVETLLPIIRSFHS